MAIGNTVEAIIGATLAPSFRKAFRDADATANRLGESVARIGAATASSKGLNTLSREVTNARAEMENASRTLDKVNKKINDGERQTDALVDSWVEAETQFEKSKKKLDGLERELMQATKQSKQFDSNTDKLAASQSKLQQQLLKTQAVQKRYNKTMAMSNQYENRASSAAMAGVGYGATAYGIGRAIMAPLSEGMEVEQSISRVNSIANQRGEFETLAEAQEALKNRILDLGATTSFTASEVAEGARFLTMAGFDIGKTIDALPSTLSLSRAGDLDLGSTADIISNIMTPFNIAADRTEEVADVLTSVITTSNTDLRMLGESMKYVAPIAKQYGMSMADTAGMVGILGNAGIQASQAGTTMRSMLIRLAAPVGKASKLISELGIAMKDAEGNMRSPQMILEDLSNSMANAGYDTAQQLDAINQIFGAEAMSGVASMMEQAKAQGKDANSVLEDYLATQRKVRDGERGLTRQVAESQQDNLAGDFKGLGSAISGSFITIYNSVQPILRTVVKGVTTVVHGLNNWAKEHPFLTRVITLTAMAVGAFTAAMAIGMGVTAAYSFAQAKLLSVNAALGLSTGSTAKKVGLLNTAMMMGTKISGLFGKMSLAGLAGSLGSVSGMVATATGALSGLGTAATAFMVSNPIGWIIGAVVALGVAVYKYWEPIKAFAAGMGEALSPSFTAVKESLSPVVDLFGSLLGLVGDVVGAIFGLFAPMESTAEGLGKATESGKGFGQMLSVLLLPLRAAAYVIGKVASGLVWVVDSISTVLTGTIGVVGNVLGGVIDTILGVGGAIYDAITAPFRLGIDLIKGIGGALSSAWDWLVGNDDNEIKVSRVGDAANDPHGQSSLDEMRKYVEPVGRRIGMTQGDISKLIEQANTNPEYIGKTSSEVGNAIRNDLLERMNSGEFDRVGNLKPVANSNVTDIANATNGRNIASNADYINSNAIAANSANNGSGGRTVQQTIESIQINVDGSADPEAVAQAVYARQQVEIDRAEREAVFA